MKVIIENVEIKKRLQYTKKKNVEIPLTTLWEHSEKVFTEDDGIPLDKWNFQKPKVKPF